MGPPRFTAHVILLALLQLSLAASLAPAAQTIHLLALRVEFPKEDPDDFTTGGNGLFDRRPPAQALAATGDDGFRYPYDLPPHDGQFLAHHLEALRNYVAVASQGQLDLTWELFPADPAAAYVAPDRLASYGSGATNAVLTTNWARFLRDALEISTTDVGDLSRFQSFLVFNASVALQGVISAELPPLVLTEREIAQSGIVIPSAVETAWFMPQQIQQPGGVIGLNGAFAKTFLASLGLPVLSNTHTGGSAVGCWTLMDVGSDNLIRRPRPEQGDTALVLGFVPCLPMAWEQMRLGWLTPEVVRRDTTIQLAGLAARTMSLPRAIKVPITTDEYFLLELRRSTFASEKEHPEINFSGANKTGVWLNPTDDDYDAYTPGSGVLVWHIDEYRVLLWEPTNEVNAHPERPAMFILEADGYRDIGITNALGHPRSNEGIGSRNDPFPITGEKQVYADGEWGPGRPVSLANDGTVTGIEITFASVGNAVDTVAVTIRWPRGGSRFIGGPVAEGIAVGNIRPDADWYMPDIAFATTDGGVWVLDALLRPVASDSGLIAVFPEPVSRKPIIESDGALLVIGPTTAMRYRLVDSRWISAVEPNAPPVPRVIKSVMDGSGTPFEFTWSDGGDISATKQGTRLWTTRLPDSIIAPPSIGRLETIDSGGLFVAGRRTVHVLSPSGLEILRFGLGRADSTEYFTGPPLTATSGASVITGQNTILTFNAEGHLIGKLAVPGTVSGSHALHRQGSPLRVIVATTEGWLYDLDITRYLGTNYPLWDQLYGDGASSNSLDAEPMSVPSDLMPSSRAFFYPSPVGNTEGKLRFYLSAKAEVQVRIYTSVGELVWETRIDLAETTAQADNEVTWPGGTKFASGLYLCRIVATSGDGRRSALTIPVGIAK